MMASAAPAYTDEAREALTDMAYAFSLVDEDKQPEQPETVTRQADPMGVEGVDWHWVRDEKVPLRLNSYEGVSVGLARPIVKGPGSG